MSRIEVFNLDGTSVPLSRQTHGSGGIGLARFSIGKEMWKHFRGDAEYPVGLRDVMAVMVARLTSYGLVTAMYGMHASETYANRKVPRMVEYYVSGGSKFFSRVWLRNLTNVPASNGTSSGLYGAIAGQISFGDFNGTPLFLRKGWYFIEAGCLWFAPIDFDWDSVRGLTVFPLYDLQNVNCGGAKAAASAPSVTSLEFSAYNIGSGDRGSPFRLVGEVTKRTESGRLAGWCYGNKKAVCELVGVKASDSLKDSLVSRNLVAAFGKGWRGSAMAEVLAARQGDWDTHKLWLEYLARGIGGRAVVDVGAIDPRCSVVTDTISIVGTGEYCLMEIDSGNAGGGGADDVWFSAVGSVSRGIAVKFAEDCLLGSVKFSMRMNLSTLHTVFGYISESVARQLCLKFNEWCILPALVVKHKTYTPNGVDIKRYAKRFVDCQVDYTDPEVQEVSQIISGNADWYVCGPDATRFVPVGEDEELPSADEVEGSSNITSRWVSAQGDDGVQRIPLSFAHRIMSGQTLNNIYRGSTRIGGRDDDSYPF